MIAEPPLLMVPRPAWSGITTEFELPVSVLPPALPGGSIVGEFG